MTLNEILPIAATVVIGYILGSINFSLIIGKLANNVDVRKHGSGNAGTTNVLRVLGKKLALFVLSGDVLKCLGAVVAGNILMAQLDGWGGWIGGISCMFGHVFPVFFSFRGGKGVATGVALMAFAEPAAGFSAAAVLFIVFIICRIVSFSSLCAFLSFPIFIWIFTGDIIKVIVGAALFIFVLILHRKNVARLIRKEEKKISFKKVK